MTILEWNGWPHDVCILKLLRNCQTVVKDGSNHPVFFSFVALISSWRYWPLHLLVDMLLSVPLHPPQSRLQALGGSCHLHTCLAHSVQGIHQLNQCVGTTSIMGTGENLPPTCPRNNPDSVRRPLSAAGYTDAQWSSHSHFFPMLTCVLYWYYLDPCPAS